VLDRLSSQIERASVSSSGGEATGFIVTSERGNHFVTGDSYGGFISDDGRFVVFSSPGENLVADDANLAPDVFLRDRSLQTTVRVSVDSAGREGSLPCFVDIWENELWCPEISGVLAASGKFVAMTSWQPNHVFGDQNFTRDVFVNDLRARLEFAGLAPVGQTVALGLRSPSAAGRPYLAGLSFGYQPGIALGVRAVPLNADALFFLSIAPPPGLLVGFSGTLDVNGSATAQIIVPNDASLIGMTGYAAFAVGDVAEPLGIAGISNATKITVGP
jgi:hypothetical protein